MRRSAGFEAVSKVQVCHPGSMKFNIVMNMAHHLGSLSLWTVCRLDECRFGSGINSYDGI